MSHKRPDVENTGEKSVKKTKMENPILDSEDGHGNREEVENDNPEEDNVTQERYFLKIFDEVLVFMQKYLDIKDEDIENAIQDIAVLFKTYNSTKVDFDQSKNLCGYFYRYSTFNAALVRKRILDALEDCIDLRNKMHKSEINIVSLGGGPGTDVLGFCCAWHTYASIKNIKHEKIVNITIVDCVKRWASFYNLIELYIREGNYGNLSTFFKNNDVNSSFLCADLFSESPSRKYKSDLRMADIVILSRVLDAQNWKENKPEKLIQNIVEGMKKKALLVLIDSCSDLYNMTFALKELYKCESNDFQLTFQQPRRFSSYHCNSSKATIIIYEKSD